MPNNITDVDAFTDPAVAPADGDGVDAAAFAPVTQALANRTRYLYSRLTDLLNGGRTITATGTNENGLTLVGSGTGKGINATGGATDGTGVAGVGGGSAGTGVSGSSTSGYGGTFAGAVGVLGTGTSAGASFSKDTTTGTGATDDSVILLQNLRFSGSNPTKTTGFSNRLTPLNTPKAWCCGAGGGASAPTFTDGFNIASLTRVSDSVIDVLFTTAMADANFGVMMSAVSESGADQIFVSLKATTGFRMSFGGDSSSIQINFVVFGRQ